MTKVNEQFIEAMQKRLDEKEKIYVGKLNYKNMTISCLWGRLTEDYKGVDVILESSSKVQGHFKRAIKKDIVDMANFCWMLWERLEVKDE